MKVLVNGIGNIGTTLLGILYQYKSSLGIEVIYALKNTPMPWHKEDLEHLQKLGIEVVTRDSSSGYDELNTIIDQVDYIFDCTNNGGGMSNKAWYENLLNLKGASAQGSEKNFGVSFMTGVNDQIIAKEKYAHIVSCNTHSIATLLTTFCGQNLDNLDEADFVIVRRSEDLGNHQRLVSANVVARHLDNQLGTHHSIDVLDLFKTVDKTFKVSSSDITTPSQLMHGVRFNLRLKNPMTQQDIDSCIEKSKWVSSSTKFDSNVIFERGRRYSFQGRIYSHAVVISNNVLIVDNQLMGWAFIPQEGNTLISTLHAFMLQMNIEKTSEILKQLQQELIHKKW